MGYVMSNLAQLSREELEAMVARFQASSQRKLTLKVSAKGAVSLYGMGRFPVTLYGSQWEKLLDNAVVIREFLKDNATLLSAKE